MRVLVADDDEAIRALVMRLFARRGDEVEGAADGEAALALLDSSTFDLLILDLMMPRLDGIGVLTHLAKRPGPPVIVMTAAIPSLAASVPREHVVAVLTKPFEIAKLISLADEAVGGRAMQA